MKLGITDQGFKRLSKAVSSQVGSYTDRYEYVLDVIQALKEKLGGTDWENLENYVVVVDGWISENIENRDPYVEANELLEESFDPRGMLEFYRKRAQENPRASLINHAIDLMAENDIVVRDDQIEDMLDLINSTKPLYKLQDYIHRNWKFLDYESNPVLAIMVDVAQEMLDVEYEEQRSRKGSISKTSVQLVRRSVAPDKNTVFYFDDGTIGLFSVGGAFMACDPDGTPLNVYELSVYYEALQELLAMPEPVMVMPETNIMDRDFPLEGANSNDLGWIKYFQALSQSGEELPMM